MERAARYGARLSLVLCDIDFFKNLNDTLGHAGGDEILRQFGARLQQNAAPRRRLGGAHRRRGVRRRAPETPYEQALEVARKLRSTSHQPFVHDRKTSSVTASFGLCGLDRVPAGERELAERVLKIADAALYRSKQAGRNRVTATCYDGPNG